MLIAKSCKTILQKASDSKMKITQWIKRGIKYVVSGQPVIVNRVSPTIVTLSPNHLLQGRTALITGGTSGIGFSIAKAFLDAGANVVITSRSAQRAEQTANQLGSNYHNQICLGVAMNNKSAAQIIESFEHVLVILKGGKVDILVNNAGIGGGGISSATEEEYNNVMDTNLKGNFFLSREVAKYMIRHSIQGNILNIASSSSLRPANSAYILSKWGVRGLTEGLGRALAPKGIVVNGIAPGPTATPMLGKMNDDDIFRSDSLIGRYITTTEIAQMAVIMVSEMSRSVIGDIVYMTGGAGNINNGDFNYTFDC